jgi:phosphopantetheinyl transferase
VTDAILWWSKVDDAVLSHVAILSAEERTRLAHLVSDRTRLSQTCSYVTRRQIVGEMIGVPPAEVKMGRRCANCGSEEHGAPTVLGAARETPISLSVSHTFDLVALLVCHEAAGLDVEPKRTPDEWDALRRRVANPADTVETPARLWTAKEAVLKLIGTGLTQPMTSIAVDEGGWRLTDPGLTSAAGALRWCDLDGGHVAAVASRSPLSLSVRAWRLRPATI